MPQLRIYLSVFVAFLSLAVALTAPAADELKIVYNVGVAPLKFEDAASRPAGLFPDLFPDLWRLWAQKAGREIELVRADSFEESLQLLEDGKVDLHAGLFRTQEREELLDYSEPLLALDYYIFTHPSVHPIKSLEKTSGFIVGIQKGGYTEQFVRAKVPGNRIAVYDRFQDLLRAALEGEIRVFVATELSLFYNLKENFLINIFEHDRDRPLYSQVYYTATKKGNPALIHQVNDGLKAIGSQERKRLEDKWIIGDFQDVPQGSTVALPEPDKIDLTDAEKTWLDQHPVIRVSSEPDYAPFDFVENGKPAGFSIDLLNMVAQRAGLRLEYVQDTWKNLVEMGQQKQIDLLHTVFYTPEREAFFHFTEPYKSVVNGIYVRDGVAGVNSLQDLAGKRVLLSKGDSFAEILPRLVPGAEFVWVDTYEEILKAISLGKGDATVMDTAVANYLIRKNTLTNIQPSAEAQIDAGDRDPRYRMAVRKDWPELQSILQKAMNTITRDEMAKLETRWFGSSAPISKARISLTIEEKDWLKANPVIRVHNEKDWPPFNYFEYGKPRGLSIDYMNLVAEQLGIKVEYVSGPSWNEFLGMVKRKELDVMLNIVKTEDRMKYLLFTEPYIKNPNVIVSSLESPFETIEALFGKTVAFPKGFFYEEVLTKSFPQIKRLPVKDTLASLKAVAFGRADAALGEAAVVRTLINKNFISGLQISGETNIGDPDLTNLRIGVRDDWPLLHSALMKAMAAIAPQEMTQIQEKWIVTALDTAAAPQTAVTLSYGRLVVYGIAVFLALSLLAWILIKTVKKEHIAVSFGSRWFRGLVLAGLSIFIIIVCLLGWFTLEKNKENILEDIAENLTGILNTADDRINLWVEQRTSYLKLLGRDPELVTLTKRLLAVKPDRESLLASDVLQETRAFFKTNKDIFANIGFFIINTDDISIGSRRDTNIGTPNLISLQRPDLLRRAFEGEVLFVPPIESDVPLVNGLKADGARNPTTKFFIGPIRDPNEQIIAIMTLRVDPSEDFSRVLTSFETRKSFETYAFNENGGRLLTGLNFF
jgi:ABC-type amino acid transport substrate-binding protein